jgi:uncharacterized protein (AIM24 family)
VLMAAKPFVKANYEIGDDVTIQCGPFLANLSGVIVAMKMVDDVPMYMLRHGVFWFTEDQVIACDNKYHQN